MSSELLQVHLPRAMDLGGTQVGARQFDLSLFTRQDNYYVGSRVTGARVIPRFAPVQIEAYRSTVELGRFTASEDGKIDVMIDIDTLEPVVLRLYNLSIDTDVMISLMIEGTLYAISRR